jgi:hypothetical protein
MGVSILDTSCSIKCTHGGEATVTSGNKDVKAGRNCILLVSDILPINGCTFQINGVPSPCVTVVWNGGTKKMKINGTPALLDTSVGTCKNAQSADQGVAVITKGVQTNVKGT